MLQLILALGFALMANGNSASVVRGAECSLALPSCTPPDGIDHRTMSGNNAGGQVHSDCRVCQLNGVPVPAKECHKCMVELDETEQAAYSDLLVAAREGNVDAVVSLAVRTPSRAAYNRERGSVQISAACDKSTIIASFRLSTEEQRRIALSLPAPEGRERSVAVGLQ